MELGSQQFNVVLPRVILSNTVDDIVSNLDSKFSEQLSVENAVMTSDGGVVRITVELWKESPVLRDHSVLCIPRRDLALPKSVLMALIEAHGHGTFPNGVQECYDLLAASVKLELPYLTWKCFAHLCNLNAFDNSVDIPFKLSCDTVLRVFKVLLGTPLRTADIYEEQLSRIARYCANYREMMTNAMNMLKQSLEKFKSINLDGIPVPFTARTVPVAVLKRKGKLQTAVVIGTELKIVDLFGARFDLGTLTGVSEFYLKYGDYLLYRCLTYVYRKNLQDDSQPTKLLENCCNLMTRGKFVFATRAEKSCSSVSLWVDGRFEKIFQNREAIQKIEFDDVTNVLAILQRTKLLLFRLENENLSLLEERNTLSVAGVLLSGEDMFVINDNRLDVKIQMSQRNQAQSESGPSLWIDVQAKDQRLFTKLSYPKNWNSIVFCGGSYFLTHNGRLELVANSPIMDRTRTLMIDEELCALSELWMFP